MEECTLTIVLRGSNPSKIYLDAMFSLLAEGKECSPRGKRIKELRPAVIEFLDPRNRTTNLRGRLINPFFQLAESFWILSGRADVPWLANYNSNMANFSDDGQYFNAAYGERLRHWGRNSPRHIGTDHSMLDQLEDCYNKLSADPDTRQAVAFIGNPSFDSFEYTSKGGKDIACNLNIKFKIRDGKLDISVDNRSNDLHWGTFGANLCQFATIQEAMASWLGIEVGTYYQISDSLHIYLDDYGHKVTGSILHHYPTKEHSDHISQITHVNEPRFTSSYVGFHEVVAYYWTYLDYAVHADFAQAMANIQSFVTDPYLRMTFLAMVAYNASKADDVVNTVAAVGMMGESSWQVACLRSLYSKWKDVIAFRELYEELPCEIIDYIERRGE